MFYELEKKKCLSGWGGFIGIHLAERPVMPGARVRALVKYNSEGALGHLDDSPLNKDTEVLLGDVRERDVLIKAFGKIDVVFHLPALIGLPYPYETSQSYIRTNVEGTLNVLQLALQEGAKVVRTSTSEVCGQIGRVFPPFLRFAGGGGSTVQHVRTVGVPAHRDPREDRTDAGGPQ